MNKRGSGARRLILLSFFRAEAERLRQLSPRRGLVYAVEEPETSQHPDNQRLVVRALLNLAEGDATQVLLTTHNPALASWIPKDSIRLLRRRENPKGVEVLSGSDDVLRDVVHDLGIFSDGQVRALIHVEGVNDVAFLSHLSRILHDHSEGLPDLSADPRVAFVPVGGSTLKQWADRHFLKGLRLPEFHLYDSDCGTKPEYAEAVRSVNSRGDGSFACLTGKREAENYLHPAAIREALGVSVSFGDEDDVPNMVARQVHLRSDSPTPWESLSDEKRDRKVGQAKRRLNNEAAARMTLERLRISDPGNDVERWLARIAVMIGLTPEPPQALTATAGN